MIVIFVCVLLVQVCGSVPLAGWVQSPGYPFGYDPHATLTWKHCAAPGHTLMLSFFHLDLEDSEQCENDVVKVFAGNVLLTKLCGRMSAQHLLSSVNPLLRSSSGGCLSLSFEADFSNPERHTGFRAFYKEQDVDECWVHEPECSHFCHNYIGGYTCSCKPGYYLSEDQHTCSANCTEELFGEGVLTPVGSPGPYLENSFCTYTLAVQEGQQLVLSFVGEFDVESRDGQCIDTLTIKTDSAVFGPFCGQTAPPKISTGAQRVQIFFHTDQGGTNTGFTLSYRAKPMQCPGNVTANSILAPQRSQYTPGDTVTVQCVTGHSLESTLQQTFESTCQKSGRWSPVRYCEPIDCGPPNFSDLIVLTEEDPVTTYNHNISVKCLSEYYELIGDANFICDASGTWVSEKAQTKPLCLPVCGKNTAFSSGRIFGGRKAQPEELPWHLLIKEPQRGGASLISDQWAVTAAHVVDRYESDTLIFYGGITDGMDRNAVLMESEKIIIHPGFEKRKPEQDHTNYDNDIALVKMSARVSLGPNIRPVCLPNKTNSLPEQTARLSMEGKMGTISGFGGRSETLTKARYLQYGHVIEYSEVPCFPNNLKVTDNMFCAGGKSKEVDSCKGDSGGPLVVPAVGSGSPNTRHQLKGIVSWGPSICGNEHNKGYYTKVENYLDWIMETMQKN
ncbi:complement C1s subcomponent [Electrophorus electricus]|uniref:Complement component 1, s subcomponent n=1 Tax=Electrophorus electricus TaxID=8005 RepID=A0A4W4EEX1_ELEEL|nr:complement C1s subcomponent [Electrophorus electricus]